MEPVGAVKDAVVVEEEETFSPVGSVCSSGEEEVPVSDAASAVAAGE